MRIVDVIISEIMAFGNPEKAKNSSYFFKTGPGQYGEGDKFVGATVPEIRLIAKKYFAEITLDDVAELLKNEWHEIRLVALIILTYKFPKADLATKTAILKLYLGNTRHINNWDLVDLSAGKILGEYYCLSAAVGAGARAGSNDFIDVPQIINKLANSGDLWEERIAIVCNWRIVKSGDFSILEPLCVKFLSHKHDLIHKATGWMLREAGKVDVDFLIGFLDKYWAKMPRTMLRYSIERLPEKQRLYYLKLGK